MYHQERGIFKPSLKTHTLPSNGVLKKFAFVQQNIKEDLNSDSFKLSGSGKGSYQILDTNNKRSSETQSNNQFGRVLYRQKVGEQNNLNSDSGTSSLTVPKFDPIIPKFIFKRFLDDSEFVKDNIKSVNNQIVQRLQTKNINYPLEVERLFKEADGNKTQYQKIKNIQKQPESKPQKPEGNAMEQEAKNNQDKEWIQNSYKQCRKQYIKNEVNKVPYFPLMGTDGSLFWCHSFDKIVLWRYQGQQFYNPDVFCILSFKHQMAPISAVYVTEVKSSILKKDRAVLISVAFFNQIKFFSFDIVKYEKQFLVQSSHQRSEEDFRKYVEKVPVKVNSNFLIEKILVKNSPNFQASPQNLRPLVIFTDGGTNLEIVDLQNISAYRTRSGFDFFDSQTRKKQEKSQNQIIKLLVCRDQVNPFVHYAFVLRKETSLQEVKPLTLIDKLKKLISFRKQFQQKQNVILTIYEWNEADLRNETVWKKIWNPPRLKKTKVLTSKDLQTKLKQTFYDFYLLNSNNQFIIADISLVQNPQKYSIFNGSSHHSSSLKVTFINGCSIMISNFRSLALSLEVKVNPYIESSVPMTACQYQNYRRLLQKGRYLQGISETKNKFNYLISEPLELQKEAKFSVIDPVVSVCNQLSCCQSKLVFQDQHQILYDFHPTNSRKSIFQLKTSLKSQPKKYIIFQSNFMTIVSTPNMAQMFILLGYLSSKYPASKQQIEQYTSSIFGDLSQSRKIHLIESLIYLLVEINFSGKVRSGHLQTKLSFDSLIQKFYGGFDPDETTYLEQRSEGNAQQKNEQTYSYSFNVNRKDYEGFVQYLLGPQISQRQKGRLGNAHNSAQNQVQIKITQTIFNFMLQILISKAIKTVYQKSFTKQLNNFEANPNLTNSIDGFLQNQNDRMYFIKLFEGMSEINESFLVCSLSRFMLHLLEPVLNLPYVKYRQFKSLCTRIVEQIDALRSFLNRFVLFSSYKDKQSKVFEETVLFLKSLQNSLPKVCLLIKLFQILSETQYHNLPLQENHKSLWTELTLRNICFKVNTREVLQRLTVESLFEENAMLLDQIEEKLPELRNIRNLRFYIGWRKMNKKIIDSLEYNLNQEKTKGNGSNREFSILPRSLVTEYEPEEEQFMSKEEKQDFLIEKALNQYSYSDFQKYFVAKRQFWQFSGILLSRIQYLQANYLRLKEVYHFNDNIRNQLEEMPFKGSFQNYPLGHKGNQEKLESASRRQVSLKSFLKYEEKTFNYQNFLRTYQLIKYLNQKLVEYITSILEIYKGQVNKQGNAVTRKDQISKSEWIFFGTSSLPDKNQKYVQRQSQYQLLSKHIEAIISSIFKKGSQYMKSQVLVALQKDDVFKVFLNQCRTYDQSHEEQNQRASLEFEDLKSRQFLLGDQAVRMKEMSVSQKAEQEQRRMYQQKLKQKFSTELREHVQVQEPGNWIKKHSRQSSLYLY